MMRVNSNYAEHTVHYIQYDIIHYTDFWMGGYLRLGYHTFCGEKLLLVCTLEDETDSSMVIQVHQDILGTPITYNPGYTV